jgi:predicted TIM-barrel fold metal-dependent hydrolase
VADRRDLGSQTDMPATPRADGWIDVHSHFSPPVPPEEQQVRWKAQLGRKFITPRPYEWNLELTLAYMDRVGIAMQMLSNIPRSLDQLKASNDYGAMLVKKHPARFGLLAALPTDSPDACLEEIRRARDHLDADGFAVTCDYNGVYLGDHRLDGVWAELDRRKAVVFAHPNAVAPALLGQPTVLLEVAFDTARTITDMIYAGVFRRYPNFTMVLAHCGGALPALSGRLIALGTQSWVPNPNGITREEMTEQLRRLYLDTAASATPQMLRPALEMTTCDHIVYGSDCGVPCTTDATMDANLQSLLSFDGLTREQIQSIGTNAARLFPAAAARAALRARPDNPA